MPGQTERTSDCDPATSIARALREARADTSPASQRRADELQWELAQHGASVIPFEIRRLKTTRVPREELEQEALLGLFAAAARFDPERGLRFGTFARWHVRHRLQTHAAKAGPVVAQPVSATRARSSIRRAIYQLETSGRSVTTAAIAELTNLSEQRVRDVRDPIRGHDFHGPADDREGRSWAEKLPAPTLDPAAEVDRRRAVRKLRQVLRSPRSPLQPRERTIVQERYLHLGSRPASRRELGEALGVSGERVRQLEKRALRRLRSAMAPSEA